jgi:hypothetical protein
MTCHDTIGIYLKPFVFLAILNTFNKDKAVFVADEDVNPVNDGERYKIDLPLIADLVFTAHR